MSTSLKPSDSHFSDRRNSPAGRTKPAERSKSNRLQNSQAGNSSRKKRSTADTPAAVSVLSITGQHLRGGYLVRVNDRQCVVHDAQFLLLLELALALLTTPKSPYVYWWTKAFTHRTSGSFRKLAQRLWEQLGNSALIQSNGHGGYRLVLNREEIDLCDTLWVLPPQLVPQSLISQLQLAWDRWAEALRVDERSTLTPPKQ